jgi:methylenetetrahydrofolate dehydrogenase(NAD+)/5,10-methenyltetrahydrofolate cyclohydrolase
MLLHTDGAHESPGGNATVKISHGYTPKELLEKPNSCGYCSICFRYSKFDHNRHDQKGTFVIYVEIKRVQDPVTGKSKLVGDVDFGGVKKKANDIIPVPRVLVP